MANAVVNEDWGVGGAGVVANPSPFPRVNTLRQQYLEAEYRLDAERAALVTEAYSRHEGEPRTIKMALAFAHILDNCSIAIDEYELIVGHCTASSKACPVFPEFSYDWIAWELRHQPFRDRPHNSYSHTAEVDTRLLALAEYWRGNTVAESILEGLDDGVTAGSTFGGLGIYALDSCTYAGVGHVIPDFQRVYELGWLGLREKVKAQLDGLSGDGETEADRRNFYRAQLIAIDAAVRFSKRYATLARKLAGRAADRRRSELLQIADICDWIAEQPPRSFWEALQLGFFVTNNVLIESNGHSVSYGRFDQNMYPYFERDMASGDVSREFVQELIESAMVKCCGYMKLRSWETTQENSGRGLGGLTLTLGGVDSTGRDATNALSYMCLDAIAHTQLSQPWVVVRVHEETPAEFLERVARVIKIGSGEPKVVNDRVIIASMEARGCSREEARGYSMVGLVEPDLAGCEYSWHDAAYFSVARVLELALNNGRPFQSDGAKAAGPATGSLADFQSFDQLQCAYEAQLAYWVEQMTRGVNVMDLAHQRLKPLPYLSLLVGDCIERGVDVSSGGARHNFTGVQAVGLATVADSLAAIKQLVFDEKKVSGAEFLQALSADWQGHDYLHALVNGRKVHHYGNDDAYADTLARYVADVWCREVAGRPNARAGVFQPGIFSVSSNVSFGKLEGATPDGRRAGEPLADGISPVHTPLGSHDHKGITAVIKSASALNQEAVGNGVLLNLKLRPSALQSEHADRNLVSLIRTYFRRGGMHLQLSVMSREILEAAERHPEKYRGLLVYVAGYSTLWCELGETLKQDIISRTELSFDDNSDLTPPD